jgi:hypothetical protein
MDSGQWTVDSGQWTVDSGQWTVDSGQWTVDSGQWGTLDSRMCSLGTEHRTGDSRLRKFCCGHRTEKLTLDTGDSKHSELSSGHLTVNKIKLVTGQ